MGILIGLRARPLLLLLAVVASGACVPDLDTDESLVTSPRVLAVRAEPAEATPGTSVRYTALVADGQGARRDGLLAWFYCLARKPLAELGPVSRSCLSPSSEDLADVGAGNSVSARLPQDGCSLFGPNVPQPEPGELPARPVDPDGTGGYKQPLMLGVAVDESESLTLFEQRISCDLPGVSSQIAADYRLRYHANVNPRVRALIATLASGESVSLRSGDLLQVSPGETVGLSARWPDCPDSDSCGDSVCGPDETRLSCAEDCAQASGCDGSERYLWYDGEARELTVRRESMSLSWYKTAGSYADERTGVDEDDTTTHSDNTWTAPDGTGEGTLWVVLRDARGGVASFELAVDVR